jgi:hypothetical protein
MTATVIDLATIRATRSRRAEERAANYAHCVEIAQPMSKLPSYGAPVRNLRRRRLRQPSLSPSPRARSTGARAKLATCGPVRRAAASTS